MGIARFMASPVGRGGRIAFGVSLIVWGSGYVDGAAGSMIAIAGLLPLGLGIVNACIAGPLLNLPFEDQISLDKYRSSEWGQTRCLTPFSRSPPGSHTLLTER